MTPRYTVVSVGRRDDYQVALALWERGLLDSLLTDLYIPDFVFRLAQGCGIADRGLLSRHQTKLPARVASSGLLVAELHRRLLHMGWPTNDEVIGRAAARRLRGKTHLVVYSYYWPAICHALSQRERDLPITTLFQVHPPPSQVREVISHDRNRTGIADDQEAEELLAPRDLMAYEDALRTCASYICTSSFVEAGLLTLGIPRERITRTPYGAPSVPSRLPRLCRQSLPLQVVFVGQISYRKGLHHLLEAVRQFTARDVILTIATRSRELPSYLKPLPPNVRVLSAPGAADLARLYLAADVCVVPSLLEGFGLVILEAMGHGCPVITTTNTGGADLISHDVDGWIVPPGDSAALTSLLDALRGRLADLPGIRAAAATTASRYPWSRFREGVAGAVTT